MKKEYVIPIFVPHLGCPQDCTFCNQKKISGESKQVTAEDVRNIINQYLDGFKYKDRYIEVAFFGGSFTGIDPNKQEELLGAAHEFIKAKKIDSIRLSTRPDYIDKEVLKRLKKYGVKTIELGVQSSNDYVLKKCRRGHTFEDVINASKLIRRAGFTLGHQMMVGLPESTREDELQTAMDLIKLKPKIVRIYPVLVIKGTKLEQEYLSGEYEPLTVKQAADICKDLLKLFESKKITVIRIGLQNTSEIQDPEHEESQVVCGPFHPAFRQLVESELWYEKLVDVMRRHSARIKELKIEVNPRDVNNVVGHKRCNIEKILNVYDVNLIVKTNKKIKRGRIKSTVIV